MKTSDVAILLKLFAGHLGVDVCLVSPDLQEVQLMVPKDKPQKVTGLEYMIPQIERVRIPLEEETLTYAGADGMHHLKFRAGGHDEKMYLSLLEAE